MVFQQDIIQKLESLLRNVQHNPGLQFTTSFVFVVQEHSFDPIPHENINGLIGRVIPFLANVRHIHVWLKDALVEARILQSLSSSAPLTHLKLTDRSLSSDDFLQFLYVRPTIEWLDVYSSKKPRPSQDVQLPAGALSRLLYLAIPVWEMAPFKNPIPSLFCLSIDYMSPTDMSVDRIAALQQTAPSFASTSRSITYPHSYLVSQIFNTSG